MASDWLIANLGTLSTRMENSGTVIFSYKLETFTFYTLQMKMKSARWWNLLLLKIQKSRNYKR